MRPSLLRSTLVFVMLAACERPAPPVQRRAPVSVRPTTGQLAEVVSVVDTVTLAEWLAAHPADLVSDTARVGVWDEALCRTSTAPVEGTGGRLVRTALFELPERSAGDTLPSAADPRDWCRLRTVEVSAAFPDSASAEPLADSLGRQLAAAFGTAGTKAEADSHGSDWHHITKWVVAGRQVLLAVVPDVHPAPPLFEGDHPDPPAARRVLVIRFAAGGALDPGDETRLHQRDTVERAERGAMRALADGALTMAALPALDTSLRPLLAALWDDRREDPPDSAILKPAQLVHAAAPGLPPARRAAALTALDFVAGHILPRLPLPHSDQRDDSLALRDSLLRTRLAAAGLTYTVDPMETELTYRHAPLTTAYATDSMGPGGHPAFLMLTAAGWETGAGCGSGANQFEAVIAHGEADLRRGHEDPMTHYFVGLAWADAVTMGGERSGAYAHERATFARRAPAARTKAVAHLRAAIAGLRDPVLRRNAWRTGMALLLGQSTNTRFFCLYMD